MAKKKLCEICGQNPAAVPDRERMGRLINRVCSSCHALRIIGDIKAILALHDKRRAGSGVDHERTNGNEPNETHAPAEKE